MKGEVGRPEKAIRNGSMNENYCRQRVEGRVEEGGKSAMNARSRSFRIGSSGRRGAGPMNNNIQIKCKFEARNSKGAAPIDSRKRD